MNGRGQDGDHLYFRDWVVRYDAAPVQPPAPAVVVPAPCLDVTGAGGISETPETA